MSISWQTGEPPCGQELLIEYEWDSRKFHAVATHNGSFFVDASTGEDMSRITLLRWSTLDDDRSAMAMGALEKLLLSTPCPVVEIDRMDGDWFVKAYDERLGSLAPTGVSLSLIEAIEKLTADRQTKGVVT